MPRLRDSLRLLADRRWRPAPALIATLGLHAAALPALAVAPWAWPAVLGVLLANHAALGVLGLLPGNRWIGPTLVRLPAAAAARGEVALTFDDGPHPTVTPQVLDLLDRHGARASFFCIGRRAAAHPHLVREIVARGHSVENHSHRHDMGFALRGPQAIRRELLAAQAVLTAASGTPPRFVRAPFGIRGPMLDPALAGTGLRHVAWTRRGRDTVCNNTGVVLARLSRGLAAGDVLLLHDGASAIGADGTPVVLTVLPALLATLTAQGLRAVTLRAAL
jgi:peptidoglycan/xylan/chitin deacetylase (PgdA/CDA1 family)